MPSPIRLLNPAFPPAQPGQIVDRARDGAAQAKADPGLSPGAAVLLLASIKRPCPAWLKNAVFRDDTALASQAVNHGQVGVSQASDPFTASLQQHLALRWMHDRSSAADHLGSAGYAERRRQQLLAMPGAGYLAGQYGLLTVKSDLLARPLHQDKDMQHGLTLGHDHSPSYQRFDPVRQMWLMAREIYQGLGHAHSKSEILFVNSPTNAMRLLGHLAEHQHKSSSVLAQLKTASGLGRHGGAKIVPLHSGLVAIEFEPQHDMTEAKKFLKLLGCRPSHYLVDKIYHQTQHPAPSTVPETGGKGKPQQTLQPQAIQAIQNNRDNPQRVDNHLALQSISFTQLPQAIAALQGLPAGHAMHNLANNAAALLAGLQSALGQQLDTPGFKHDLLIANAIDTLASTARMLPTLAQDSSLFVPAYTALIEEINLLLYAVRPYRESHFKQAAAKLLNTRCGPALDRLQIVKPETYLLSSGMEAISLGVEMARKMTGMKRTQSLSGRKPAPDYFETLHLQSKGHWYDQDRIRMAPLNPTWLHNPSSDDGQPWNADKLAAETIAWVAAGKMKKGDPAVLVLDATVEQAAADGQSDLAIVIDKLQPLIDDGRLKIVLCKSYQKYTSLGTAKIMAGSMTVLAKDDARTQLVADHLKKAEQDLGWMQNDESQLLTHILTHAHGGELDLIGNAAENAAFVDGFCFQNAGQGEPGKILREDGLPFLIVNDGSVLQIEQLLSRQVEQRSGFGFMATSMLKITQSEMRINIGSETREELVEKMYSLGWKLETGQSNLTIAAAREKIAQIAADAIASTLREVDVLAWAPVALQVVGKRLGSDDAGSAAAVERCTVLLDQIAGVQSTAAPLSADHTARQKAALKDALETLLRSSEHLTQSLASEQLRIVGSAFAPQLPDHLRVAGNVGAMLAATRRPPGASALSGDLSEGLERARYASNAVASVLAMSGMALVPPPLTDDEPLALAQEALYGMGLESGLPGVSPATRANIVLDWATVSHELLNSGDTTVQRAAADALVRYIQFSPYPETAAKILRDIPDQTFARLEPPVQQRLTEALFAPLDVDTRLLCIQTLAKKFDFTKLRVCVERFDADLARHDHAKSNLLMPDNLSDTAARPIAQLRPLTQEKRDQIHAALREYRPVDAGLV